MRGLLALLLLCGCLEKIGVGDPDAGPSDASDSGARDADPDSGSTDAADAEDAGDAGEIADGGDAGTVEPLTFGTMTFPTDQFSPTSIWGRSSTELLVGTFNGNVLSFSPEDGWQLAWHEPSNFGIVRIRGTAQNIFVASNGSLHVHSPSIGENVRSMGAGSWIYDLEVVSDDEAYLVADITNGRAVFAYDGTGVEVLNDQLDAAVLYGVFADTDGTLFVTGNGKIFRYQSFTWTTDPIDWPDGFQIADIANFDLYDIARVGDDLFAAGDEHHVLRWDGSQWVFVYEPMHGEYLDQLGALSAREAYAVGRAGTGGPIARFYDGAWSHAVYDENHNFFDLWIAGPDEIFAAGVVGSTFEPVILRGFR